MDFLIHHMLRTSATRRPDKEAVVHGDLHLTYREVQAAVAGVARGLQAAGLERGGRVGIYLDASVPQVLSIFGVSQAGGVFVPMNTQLFPAQVLHVANDCRITGLITSRAGLASLGEILKDVPSLRFVAVTDPVDTEVSPHSDAVTAHDFSAWTAAAAADAPRDAAIDKDLAGILYTSGSTGKPKGVMLSHAQVMAGSAIVSTYLGIRESERILAALPFTFDAGLNQLMTAFQNGATIVLINFVFARQIVDMLSRERITALAGVPTLWGLLAQPASSLHNRPLPHLRYITNTGGAMPQRVLATLRKVLPTTDVVLMYGLTEAFRSTYLPPSELDRRPTSMGKAIPNTEILVVSPDGTPCAPGEVGELVHRGPTVSMGYWGQPEMTASVLRPHPFLAPELGGHERVCYSGDLVTMDEDGFLYFVGRRDTMIKSSGIRISPTEVEEVLFQSGRVKEAAVVGVPDELLGQVVKAFVVARDGEDLDDEELREYCAGAMPAYMVPKIIQIVTGSLPKTSSGKVDYATLRREAQS